MQLSARIMGDRGLFEKLFKKVSKEVEDLKESEIFDAIRSLWTPNGNDAFEEYAASKLIASDAHMRCAFSSNLIAQFMDGVSVLTDGIDDIRFAVIDVRRDVKIKIETLKHLNFLVTIMSPRLKVVEYRGYDVVKTIFDTLDSEEGYLLLPDDLQQMYERLRDSDSKKRLICDFVAGMTDRYAIEFFSRLKESSSTIFKPL